MYTSLLVSTLITLFNISKRYYPTFIKLDPIYKSYVLKIAFYHKLFQHSKTHPLFQLSLGNSLRNANRMSEKTVSLGTLFPVCVLIILPYESSSQNPNIDQTFRTFKTPKPQNPSLMNIINLFLIKIYK